MEGSKALTLDAAEAGLGAMTTLLVLSSLVASAGAQGYRIACLGDSITRGDASHEKGAPRGALGRGNYPKVLQAALGPLAEVRNFGVSGATASHHRTGSKPLIDQWAFAAAQKFAPDVALWMLGTNDSKDWDRERYVHGLTTMVKTLGARINIVLAPPPVFRDAWGIKNEYIVNAVPPAAREVATATRAIFFNLGEHFRVASSCNDASSDECRTTHRCDASSDECRSHYVRDGVHTSEFGAALIARLAARPLALIEGSTLRPALSGLLGKRPHAAVVPPRRLA